MTAVEKSMLIGNLLHKLEEEFENKEIKNMEVLESWEIQGKRCMAVQHKDSGEYLLLEPGEFSGWNYKVYDDGFKLIKDGTFMFNEENAVGALELTIKHLFPDSFRGYRNKFSLFGYTNVVNKIIESNSMDYGDMLLLKLGRNPVSKVKRADNSVFSMEM